MHEKGEIKKKISLFSRMARQKSPLLRRDIKRPFYVVRDDVVMLQETNFEIMIIIVDITNGP